jgi:hypothetical protein
LGNFRNALPAMRWFVKPIIPRNGRYAALRRSQDRKKTFLALSIAYAIAAGLDWCGLPTTKGKVLLIVGEGFFGVLRRLRALELMHDIEVNENLRLLPVPVNFYSEPDVRNALDALKAQGFEPDFVVIDTLARSMSGGKENVTEDMARVFELMDLFRARALANEVQERWSTAGVGLVHHTGKEGIDNRGSSVIKGAVDAMIKIESGLGSLEITLTSDGYKDAADFDTFAVKCETVTVQTEEGPQEVLAVKERVGQGQSIEEIWNESLSQAEHNAAPLIKVMAQHFPYGATTSQLKRQCETDLKFKKTVFYEAFDCAKEKRWIVGGGKRAAR